VRRAYDAVFKVIKLPVKFDIAEIVEMSPEWGAEGDGFPNRGQIWECSDLICDSVPSASDTSAGIANRSTVFCPGL
jgi:hypothetical protein